MKLNNSIKEISKNLRKNMTSSEKILWNKLKAKKFLNIKFVRQFPLCVLDENSGFHRYIIPDFLSREHKIIIELDGSIHNIKEIYQLDREKEKLLKNLGYQILRFKNEEIVNNINITLKKIAASFSL